jgi:hypothetical protein
MAGNIARQNVSRRKAEEFRQFYQDLLRTNAVARHLFAKSPRNVDVLIAEGIFRYPEKLSLTTMKHYRDGQIGGKKVLPMLLPPEQARALPPVRSLADEMRIIEEAARVLRRNVQFGDWDIAKRVARHLGIDEERAYEIICSRKNEIESLKRRKANER